MKTIDNVMLVSNQHFDAGFFAGMRTIIEPSVKTIFEQVLGKLSVSVRNVFLPALVGFTKLLL